MYVLVSNQHQRIAKPCLPLVERAVRGQLVISDFSEFTKRIDAIYSSCAEISSGKVL